MKIRPYQDKDRTAVEFIHFETGFLGKSMSPYLSNNLLWRERVDYYLTHEKDSSFVLEDKGQVVGYLLGCLDDSQSGETMEFIRFTLKTFFKSFFLPKKDGKFWRSQFYFIFKVIFGKSDEFKFDTPKNAGHLHINLLPHVRGLGWGSKMLKKFERYAKKKGVTTIHADSFRTTRNKNTSFWTRNGFETYSYVPTIMWEAQLPKEKLDLVCYVKKL